MARNPSVDPQIRSILEGDNVALRGYLATNRIALKNRLAERFPKVLGIDFDALLADEWQISQAVKASRKSFDAKGMIFYEWFLGKIFDLAYARVFRLNRINRNVLAWVVQCVGKGIQGPENVFVKIMMGRTESYLHNRFAGILSKDDVFDAGVNAIMKVFKEHNKYDDRWYFEGYFLRIAYNEACTIAKRLHGDWMRPYAQQIAKASNSDDPVLILADLYYDASLAAKIADKIHKGSRRKASRLVHVTATSPIDSQEVQSAEGGGLFIEECGDVHPDSQKLLVYLGDRNKPTSDDTAQKMPDIRLLAATRRDLESLVDEGKFLSDLWDMLKSNVIRLRPKSPRIDPIHDDVDPYDPDDDPVPDDPDDDPAPVPVPPWVESLRKCIEELTPTQKLIIENDMYAASSGSKIDDELLAKQNRIEGGAKSVYSQRNKAIIKIAICVPSRLEAMGYKPDSPWVSALRDCLAGLPDLERRIAKAYIEGAQMGKIRPKDIAERLQLSVDSFTKIRGKMERNLSSCILKRLNSIGLSFGRASR